MLGSTHFCFISIQKTYEEVWRQCTFIYLNKFHSKWRGSLPIRKLWGNLPPPRNKWRFSRGGRRGTVALSPSLMGKGFGTEPLKHIKLRFFFVLKLRHFSIFSSSSLYPFYDAFAAFLPLSYILFQKHVIPHRLPDSLHLSPSSPQSASSLVISDKIGQGLCSEAIAHFSDQDHIWWRQR